MRISDWSSDVCSSDLLGGCGISVGLAGVGRRAYIFFSGGAGKRLGRSSGGLPLGSSITRPGPLLVERLQRDLPGRPDLFGIIGVTVEPQIGRASCRERVCQYV